MLLEGRTDDSWGIYKIYEVGYPSQPFYIGLSSSPSRRVLEHWHQRSSAANARMRSLHSEGRDCDFDVIAEFDDYHEALLFEAVQIALTPNLDNRDVVECRGKLNLPDSFWKALGKAHRIINDERAELLAAVVAKPAEIAK